MKVINKHRATPEERARAVYIGRPSILQNPFPITETEDRNTVVRRFRQYFIDRIRRRHSETLAALSKLREDDLLMCYCAPAACHGDVVKEIWTFFHENGGVDKALELFDRAYRDENHKEAAMSSMNIQTLLKLEHPEHTTLLDEESGVEKYKRHLARELMNRDASVENAFRRIMSDETELIVECRDSYSKAKLEIIKSFVEEFKKDDSNYDLALHHFKERHNHLKIDFQPSEDGVTHINVFSKGRTELGRLLSNFAHTPFKHPEYGFFSSVEAFWYWLSLGKTDDKLRTLHGFQAKKEGKLLQDAYLAKHMKFPQIENFQSEIKKAVLCKIEQNDRLKNLLKNSTLPLTHYYVWGDEKSYRITYPEKYSWIHEYISDVRDYLNGKAIKLIIAGSREYNNYGTVEAHFKEIGLKVIEIVSGMARGPDKLGVRLAYEHNLPLMKFHADWDNLGKGAGFIRNEAMAKYGDFALLFWDGVSHGTKQMIDCCKEQGIQYMVVSVKPEKVAL